MHVTAPDRPAVHDDVGGNRADHLGASAVPLDAAREVHEPAALGVGRQPGLNQVANLSAQRSICGEGVHMGLGEPAANEQAVQRRQALVVQRIERHHLRARAAQGLQVAWIIEAECRVARKADAHR